MAWLWIVLGLLAIVGSMTWILPSPMERRQGERRMKALQLGMKVRMLSLDDWAKERLDRIQLAQYLVWTDQQPRSAILWRIPDREEPWASPPDALEKKSTPVKRYKADYEQILAEFQELITYHENRVC